MMAPALFPRFLFDLDTTVAPPVLYRMHLTFIAVTVAAASGLHLQPRSPPTRAFPAMTAFRNTDEPVMPRNGSFRTIWRAPPPTSLHSPLPRRRSSNGTRSSGTRWRSARRLAVSSAWLLA